MGEILQFFHLFVVGGNQISPCAFSESTIDNPMKGEKMYRQIGCALALSNVAMRWKRAIPHWLSVRL
jgi:hypothetical protein